MGTVPWAIDAMLARMGAPWSFCSGSIARHRLMHALKYSDPKAVADVGEEEEHILVHGERRHGRQGERPPLVLLLNR